MSTPLISVIIPLYNHAEDLVACLRALKAQSYSTYEVLVVDDGSTDCPRATVEAAGLMGMIKCWIELETNQGAPTARNKGFEASSGAFVLFLDADAKLRQDALQLFVNTLERHPEASYAYSAFRFGPKFFPSQTFSFEALAKGNFIHTSSMIRREAFCGFDPDLKKLQDWDLWLTMAETGKEGIFVPEKLLEIGERKIYGMSRWIPSFIYTLPWKWIGREPVAVRRFHEAEAIIRTKHADWLKKIHATNVESTFSSKKWISLFLAAMLVSMMSLGTVVNGIMAATLSLAMLVVAYRKPSFALSLFAAELILGSRGGWLKIGADIVNDAGVGIRILLFIAFIVGWGLSAVRTKSWNVLKDVAQAKWTLPYLALIGVLVWGVVRGFALHQPFLIVDANAWGFLALLLPAAYLWQQSSSQLKAEVRSMLSPALGMLTVLTLGLFVLFSQSLVDFGSILDATYTWVRQSGLGEITDIGHGNVHRIFLASQIALLPAWLWMYVRGTQDQRPLTIKQWAAWMLLTAAIIVSFSRSFWLGLAAAAGVIGLLALRTAGNSWKEKGRRVILRPAVAIAGALVCVFLVSFASLTSAIGARLHTQEAAAMSRLDLLPVMQKGIARHPLLGSGFGATLTYQTKDPRIVAKTGGAYTTYAFEWGWLDIWYKLGIFGLIALFWVLGSLVVRAAVLPVGPRLFVWGSVLALAVVHIFTPFLNHPLGIGQLIFFEGYIQLLFRKSVVSGG